MVTQRADKGRTAHRDSVHTLQVQAKGVNEFAIYRVLNVLEECGCRSCDIIYKADQEHSIQALLKEIDRRRSASHKDSIVRLHMARREH